MVLGTGKKLQGPSMLEMAVEMVGYLLGSTDVECLQSVSPLTDCQKIVPRYQPLPPAEQHHIQSLYKMSSWLIAFSVSSSCEHWPPAGQQLCKDLAGQHNQQKHAQGGHWTNAC